MSWIFPHRVAKTADCLACLITSTIKLIGKKVFVAHGAFSHETQSFYQQQNLAVSETNCVNATIICGVKKFETRPHGLSLIFVGKNRQQRRKLSYKECISDKLLLVGEKS